GGVAKQAITFGNAGDVPVTGDWDGSGRTQIGVYRPSDATFYLGDVGGVARTVIPLGDPGDIPITGDWTGAGITQIGVYRPSDDTFYLREVPRPPPATAPVVSVPVTASLPTPPRGSRRHPRVRVRIRISWTWNHARTRMHHLQVGKLPHGAKITVKCSGRGCPMTRRSAKARHLGVLVHRLQGTTYLAGDLILITITAPGHVSERALVEIRNGRLPIAALI
ncbi:MAG: hypothetical protein WAU75_10395, partial [Solirubrobacteraceae bacterium]